MEVDNGNISERPGIPDLPFEDDFAATIALLEMEVDEIEVVEVEVEQSLEEVSL